MPSFASSGRVWARHTCMAYRPPICHIICILAVKMARFNEEQIVVAVECTLSAYGYPQLKRDLEQRDVVLQFMSGRDVFCCLPTGFGKSVCYILLPMMFDTLNHKDAGTSSIIVISPLSSLMKMCDHTRSLQWQSRGKMSQVIIMMF